MSFENILIDDHLRVIASFLDEINVLCFALANKRTRRVLWKPALVKDAGLVQKLFSSGTPAQCDALVLYCAIPMRGKALQHAWIAFLHRVIQEEDAFMFFTRQKPESLGDWDDVKGVDYIEILKSMEASDDVSQRKSGYVSCDNALRRVESFLRDHGMILNKAECGFCGIDLVAFYVLDHPDHTVLGSFWELNTREIKGMCCSACHLNHIQTHCSLCDTELEPCNDVSRAMFRKRHDDIDFDVDSNRRCASCVAEIYFKALKPEVLDELIQQSLVRLGAKK